MTLAPWEYLFKSFNSANFPDIFHPTWIASLVLLVVLTILYNVRTRALHRHPAVPRHVGVAVVDRADHVQPADHRGAVRVHFFLVLTTEIIGLGTLVWIRFVRFPPFLAAYETRLAKERYFTRQKYADPEATIKKRGGGPPARSPAAPSSIGGALACPSRSAGSASAIVVTAGPPGRSG